LYGEVVLMYQQLCSDCTKSVQREACQRNKEMRRACWSQPTPPTTYADEGAQHVYAQYVT
jgi:hypothetical protein